MSTTRHPPSAQHMTTRPSTAAQGWPGKLPVCQPGLRAGLLHPLPAQLPLSIASPPPRAPDTHITVGSASIPTPLLPQGLQREGQAAAAPQ